MMDLLKWLIMTIVCSILLAIIIASFIIDKENYKLSATKKYILYLFKDGTKLLSKSLDGDQLQKEIKSHGELIEIMKDVER